MGRGKSVYAWEGEELGSSSSQLKNVSKRTVTAPFAVPPLEVLSAS